MSMGTHGLHRDKRVERIEEREKDETGTLQTSSSMG